MTNFKKKISPHQKGHFFNFLKLNPNAVKTANIIRKYLSLNILRYCSSFHHCVKLCNLKICKCVINRETNRKSNLLQKGIFQY